MKKMESNGVVNFIPGPPIEPADDLLTWFLKQTPVQGKRRRIQLPVVVIFEDIKKESIREVFVNAGYDTSSRERLKLDLDDSGMGVPLSDMIQTLCPEEKLACLFWIEGYWGPLVADDDEVADVNSPDLSRAWPFAVLKCDLDKPILKVSTENTIFIEVID